MIKGGAVERYGKALFELAVEESQLDRFVAELKEIYKLLENHTDLVKLLNHPRIQEGDKKDLMKRILDNQVSPLILNFIMLLIDKGRESLLKDIIKFFQRLAKEARGILEVQVLTALELTSDNQAKLSAKLQEFTGKVVDLQVTVDPTLIGGLRLRIGDQVIDGSVQRHLERIKENLAQIQVSQVEVS